jgi:hypothetical protein
MLRKPSQGWGLGLTEKAENAQEHLKCPEGGGLLGGLLEKAEEAREHLESPEVCVWGFFTWYHTQSTLQ